MSRTLLIVSGGSEAVPGILRAIEMGLHVVVSDGDPAAPGFEHADDRLVVSTYDVEATVTAVEGFHRAVRPIDGVICIAADVPLTVASVADALGLPGIPVESARLAADKLAMKERFAERGVAAPWFSAVESETHLRSIAADRGFPLVIKPVDSRGARGVLRLTGDVDLAWAYAHASEWSPTSRVMVEECLVGPQVSTESFLLDGSGVTPGFADRNYELIDRFAPWIIENGGEQPSALSEEQQVAVSALAEEAARAIGIRTWTAKGDMVMTTEGPKVIEIAARLSGGWFCTDQVPLATGVDFVGAAIRLALGEVVTPEEITPTRHSGVAIRYFLPEPGRVVSIEGADRFEDAPWVHRLGLSVGVGDVVEQPTNHTHRAGFVITTGDTRDEAIARAREVVESVRIRTTPS